MKETGKILWFLMVAVLAGALLAPPLFWGGRWLAGVMGFTFLAEQEFEKYFNRAVLVAALGVLWPLVRAVRQVEGGWRGLGLERDPRGWRHLAGGFLASFLVMAALGAVLIGLEIYRFKHELPWGGLGKVALSAVVVSVIEEFFFRGALLGLLRRSLHDQPAMVLTAALYSIVHFLKPPETAVADGAVRWWSGLQALAAVFWQFGEPLLVLGGFTTLLLIGWILAAVTVRTRSLWMAIGLHAGWIFGAMGFSKLTKRLNRDTLPWIGQHLSVGLVALGCVLLTGLLVWLMLRREKDGTAPPLC